MIDWMDLAMALYVATPLMCVLVLVTLLVSAVVALVWLAVRGVRQMGRGRV